MEEGSKLAIPYNGLEGMSKNQYGLVYVNVKREKFEKLNF